MLSAQHRIPCQLRDVSMGPGFRRDDVLAQVARFATSCKQASRPHMARMARARRRVLEYSAIFFTLTIIIGVLVFISNAYAQATTTAAEPGLMGNLTTFLPLILMFVVMYFLMIRPQQKRQKELRTMMDALTKGDEVVTAGGILGRVAKVGDIYVTIEVAPNTEVVVQKSAITMLLPKGTIKSM
jgi:preprotein translocase subunit YajC